MSLVLLLLLLLPLLLYGLAAVQLRLVDRLQAYVRALSRQYALGAVVRAWFFGSRIAPIPLAMLFASPRGQCEPGAAAAAAGSSTSVLSSDAHSQQQQTAKEKKDV